MKRLALLEALEERWKGCTSCGLHVARTRVVHWRGNPSAPLMLIGEAPGADEDKAGLPFVGQAGQMLDTLLERAGLNPSEQVFIANMVGCRPPGNRPPERPELSACAPRLQYLLKVVKPNVLVLLGATAAKLAGIASTVTAHRGEVTSVDMLCYDGEVRDWPAIVTFHPSYILRTGGEKGENFGKLLKDLQKAKRLAWP